MLLFLHAIEAPESSIGRYRPVNSQSVYRISGSELSAARHEFSSSVAGLGLPEVTAIIAELTASEQPAE